MQTIAQSNIDRYKLLLETEAEPTKRAMIRKLLAEEEDKQRFDVERKQQLRK